MKKMNLKAKIMAICLSVTLLGAVGSGIGFYFLNLVSGKYNTIATADLPQIKRLGELRGSFRELRIQIRSIAFMESSDAEVRNYVKSALHEVDQVEEQLAALQKNDPQATTRPSFKHLQEAWTDFKAFGGVLVKKAAEYEKNKVEITHLIREVCPVKAEVFYKALAEETNQYMNNVDTSVQMAVASENQAKSYTAIVFVFAILISMVISYFFAHHLVRMIGEIANRLTRNTDEVKQATGVLANVSQSVSEGATQAAAMLEESSAAIHQVTSMVHQNTEKAKTASEISEHSLEAASKGEKSVGALIESMQKFSESSRKMRDIVSIIDDIAFQTNLLALNASVEAARAGEAGRGFAVVADAVRSLAGRSATSAREISELIKHSLSLVDEGGRRADESRAALAQLITSIQSVSSANRDISDGSKEQSAEVSHIGQAMQSLDEATQKNAQASVQVATTADELKAKSESVERAVADLRSIIGSTRAA